MMLSSKPKALIAVPLPDDLMAKVEACCDSIVAPSGFFPTRDELLSLAGTADGIATTVMCRLDREALEAASRLRVIAQCGVGLDHIDLALASERGVAVCNTPNLQDAAVAEMTLAMLFALARNLAFNDRFVRDGQWAKGQAPLARDIRGKRLGLIGMGGVGRTVARSAAALGMDVVYNKRSRDTDMEAQGFVRHVDRDELLRTSDFVSLHLPLTEGTRGLLGRSELASMKPGSFLINTARGAIIDEEALIEALERGPLAGAGLDAMVEEPLPLNHPLCRLPNVILQPHASGATHETRRAMEELTVDNLLAVLSGSRPPVIVNPEVLETTRPAGG
jgi:glyoxylate reductase